MHGIPPLHVLSAKSPEAERVKWGKIKAEDINHHSHHNNQKGSKRAGRAQGFAPLYSRETCATKIPKALLESLCSRGMVLVRVRLVLGTKITKAP